jgi:hypothetical protein
MTARARFRLPRPDRAVTAFLAAAAAVALAAPVARAQEAASPQIDPQLQEIRTLIREKRYPLALESLRLVARQIQDLRLESLNPALPPPPPGWTAEPALSLLEEDEIWSSRIHAQRSYAAAGPSGPSRMDLLVDVHSPFAASAALAFNPIALAADPLASIVDVAGERGLARYNPDSGEGELRVVIGRETLVRVTGRGIDSPQVLINLGRRVDFALLRAAAGR